MTPPPLLPTKSPPLLCSAGKILLAHTIIHHGWSLSYDVSNLASGGMVCASHMFKVDRSLFENENTSKIQWK